MVSAACRNAVVDAWLSVTVIFHPEDRQILFCSRQQLARLFSDFNESCVLMRGNLRLSGMLKDVRSDSLVAIMQPGNMLWALHEYERVRLADSGAEASLLQYYLQRARARASVAGVFL